MRQMRLFCLFLLAACGSTVQPQESPRLQVDGFTSRETVGEEPMFDLKASKAKMFTEQNMDIQDVRFTLFRNGVQSGLASANFGLFNPRDKTVELHGKVIYRAFDDSFQVQAQKMAWDPKASVLICETDVSGFFREFQFSADRLDIAQNRSAFHLKRATFSGPG